MEKRDETRLDRVRYGRRERDEAIYSYIYTVWMEEERERQLHPCAAVAVAVAETEPALVIYINPIIAWRFPN